MPLLPFYAEYQYTISIVSIVGFLLAERWLQESGDIGGRGDNETPQLSAHVHRDRLSPGQDTQPSGEVAHTYVCTTKSCGQGHFLQEKNFLQKSWGIKYNFTNFGSLEDHLYINILRMTHTSFMRSCAHLDSVFTATFMSWDSLCVRCRR